MGFPDIEASEIGNTGLLWLFVSYGYVLFWASNQISEGSDLLLLVPSLAGIVGSCVLPVLGAVPDGAIMLFSGLGSVEEAQENLAVGVGALAGSTIMLLTARGRRLENVARERRDDASLLSPRCPSPSRSTPAASI